MESTNPISTSTTTGYLNADKHNTTIPSMLTTSSSCHPQANCHNAPTNIKMTLADARTELESHGFVILEEQNQQELHVVLLPLPSSNWLIGHHSECRWCCTGKIDTLVFVQELESDVPLTVNRINEDLKNLRVDWLLSLPPSFYSPIGCPPHGLFRDCIVIMVYLVQQSISSDVALYLTQRPSRVWNQLIFLAAQDGTSNITPYYCDGQDTPFAWGRFLFPEAQYWAAVLTGRRPLPKKSLPNKVILNIIHISFIITAFVMQPLNTASGQKFWLIVIGFFFVMSLLYNAHYQYKRREHQQRHAWLANNNNMAKMDVESSNGA